MKRHAALVPLSRQHHDGLALGVFIERGLRDSASPANAARLREEAVKLWELELSGHFAVEESYVFPVARASIPEPGLVDQLLSEHEELRRQFASLAQGRPDQLARLLGDLRELLVRHIRTEERVLFEAIQEHASAEDLAILARQVEEALPTLCLSLGSARG